MKRISLRTSLLCGLALSFGSWGHFIHSNADRDKVAAAESPLGGGGQKGGGKPPGGGGSGGARGGHAQAGGIGGSQTGVGAGGHSSKGGNAPGISGRGGIHAPSIPGSRSHAGQGGQIPFSSRTPSFSHPAVGGGRGVTAGPPVAANPAITARTRIGSGTSRAGSGLPGTIVHRDHDLQGQLRPGTTMLRHGYDPSRIGNRPFAGNTIDFRNRSFNVGHSLYQPSHYRHSGYHGYWNGNRSLAGSALGSGLGYGLGSGLGYGGGYNSGWGWGLGSSYGGLGRYRIYNSYGYRPIGWGLGGWGLGSLIYNSGYLGYSNPYYSNLGPSIYNYSQPISVIYNAPATIAASDLTASEQVLNNAVAAFQQNDYDAALDITNKGIAQYSDDAVLHEFRSLVLFAKQDYQQSAATIHSVLAVGPGWDWTTLSSMYSSVPVYTAHLRTLEAFTKSNQQDAASQFLLAYHYMTCGHPEAAGLHLQQVVRLMPNDRVAADLLKMILPPEPGATGETSTTSVAQLRPRPALPDVKPVDQETLVGTWEATRADGSVFDLVLTNDAVFNWKFAPKDQASQEFGGTYSVEENVLVLERKDGGSLIAEVTPGGEGKFNFRLLGTDDEDPGLDFSK